MRKISAKAKTSRLLSLGILITPIIFTLPSPLRLAVSPCPRRTKSTCHFVPLTQHFTALTMDLLLASRILVKSFTSWDWFPVLRPQPAGVNRNVICREPDEGYPFAASSPWTSDELAGGSGNRMEHRGGILQQRIGIYASRHRPRMPAGQPDRA